MELIKLKIWNAGRPINEIELHLPECRPSPYVYNLDLTELYPIMEPDEPTKRRRGRNRRLLNRLGDPDQGFPLLRQLIQTVGPLLIQYLITQLPLWLADLDDYNQQEPPA